MTFLFPEHVRPAPFVPGNIIINLIIDSIITGVVFIIIGIVPNVVFITTFGWDNNNNNNNHLWLGLLSKETVLLAGLATVCWNSVLPLNLNREPIRKKFCLAFGPFTGALSLQMVQVLLLATTETPPAIVIALVIVMLIAIVIVTLMLMLMVMVIVIVT